MKSADTRDMFAAAAMAALVQRKGSSPISERGEIAWASYEIAEAMMAERAKQDRTMPEEWRQVEQEIDAQRQMGVTI